jgi:uncharacterized membrane protein YbaN (DUF454 family)
MSGGGGKGGGDSFSSRDAQNLLKTQGEQARISQYGPSGNLIYGSLTPQGTFQQTPGLAAMTQESPYQSQMRQAGENTSAGLFNQVAPQAWNLQNLSFNGLPERQYQVDWSKVANLPQGMDWSKVQGVPGADQFSGMADKASNAIYERGMSMMRPDLEQGQRRLDQRLADQGLPIGSEAYTTDQNRYQRQSERSMQDLALGAVGQGQNQANQLFQQALQGRSAQIGDQTLGLDWANQLRQSQIGDQTLNMDLANQARLAGFGEQQALRSNQLSELQALLGGQAYNPTPAPNFFGPGQVDPTAGAQMQQNSNLSQQQAQNALWGNLAGLGGAGIFAASMPGALFCWVAREVYGNKDHRWIKFREWLVNKAPKWLLRLYVRKGAKFATWLHRHPRFKPAIRFLMDRVI